jgi:hypothetical protein
MKFKAFVSHKDVNRKTCKNNMQVQSLFIRGDVPRTTESARVKIYLQESSWHLFPKTLKYPKYLADSIILCL